MKADSLLFCALLSACAGEPQNPQTSSGALLDPIVRPSATSEINIPLAQNVTALSDAPVIRITESEVLFNQVKVADINNLVNADAHNFAEKPVLRLISGHDNPIEALGERINRFDEGRNFDGRLLIEADKETDPQILFKVLRSAAWAGYSQPSFVVRGATSQKREQLATATPQSLLEPRSQEELNPDVLGLSEWSPGCSSGSIRVPYGVEITGPNLTARKAKVTGKIDKELVRRSLLEASGPLIDCYKDARKKDPSLSGEVVVSFSISANGSVESATTTKGLSKDLDDCSAQQISKLSFPEVPRGGAVSVVYPFSLEMPKNPQNPTLAPDKNLVLRVGMGGFEIFSGGPSTYSFIVDDKLASISKRDDYEELYTQLKKLKEQNPSHRTLIIITQTARYDELIQAADTGIKAGLSSIFFVPSRF